MPRTEGLKQHYPSSTGLHSRAEMMKCRRYSTPSRHHRGSPGFETSWRMKGPSSRILDCGIYRVSTGLEVSVRLRARGPTALPAHSRDRYCERTCRAVAASRACERWVLSSRRSNFRCSSAYTSSLLGQHAERFDRKAIFFVNSDLTRINVCASWITENGVVFNLRAIRLFSECGTNKRKLLFDGTVLL
jgi:hypothetical protein